MIKAAEVLKARSSHLAATAYHEAGHAVAAWQKGSRVRSVTIVPSSGAHGTTLHQNPLWRSKIAFDKSDRMRLRCEKAIIIALAGAAAQKRYAPRSWRKYHGAEDFEYATELAIHIAGPARDAFMKWMHAATAALIDSKWVCVESLARELIVNKILNDRETLAAIEKPISNHLAQDIGLQQALKAAAAQADANYVDFSKTRTRPS